MMRANWKTHTQARYGVIKISEDGRPHVKSAGTRVMKRVEGEDDPYGIRSHHHAEQSIDGTLMQKHILTAR